MDLKIVNAEKNTIRVQEIFEKIEIYKRNIKIYKFTINELEKEIENLQDKNEKNHINIITYIKEKELAIKNYQILLLKNNFLKISHLSEDFFILNKIDKDSILKKPKCILNKESKSSLGGNFKKFAKKNKVQNIKNFLLAQIKNSNIKTGKDKN